MRTGKSARCLYAADDRIFPPESDYQYRDCREHSKEIHNKDVIIAIDSVQHDFDISPFGWKKGELPDWGDLPAL
jgi:hypothetical protein